MRATLQFGQLRASPQALQSSEVENPRRLRKRIVCSRFSSRAAIAARNFSDRIVSGIFFAASCRRSTIANERHLIVVHALGQRREPILAESRVVIALERGRRGAEHHHAFLHLPSHDRDIARVITRRFFLLVGRFVFFIDDDQPEVFQRGEDRAPCADDDVRAAGLNLVPFVVALAFGQTAVQDRDQSCVSAKRLLKRSTVCGVSEISGTSTIAVCPRLSVARIACR